MLLMKNEERKRYYAAKVKEGEQRRIDEQKLIDDEFKRIDEGLRMLDQHCLNMKQIAGQIPISILK